MALTRRSISPDDKHIILFDCSEQLLQTARIVNHLILNQWHSLSRVFKDAGEACLQIFKSGENRKGFPFVDTLADVTPLVLSNNELLIEIQAMYFSVTIFLMALTLGQIVGNLWTEFAWAPQMAVHQALIVILLLPLQLSVERLHETLKQRRSELFIKIFFIGFSMGRLCDYNLMLNSPKIICPMVFSILVDNSSGKQEETRLELFINLALIVNGLVCFLLLLNARITFFCFVLSFICCGINLKILFMHFQLFYYGLTQINREKFQKPIWCVSNPWLANADIVYVFCVLAFDVLISVI